MNTRIAEAASLRMQGDRYPMSASRPSERRAAEPSDATDGVLVELRSAAVTRAKKDDGAETATVVGFASITEAGYEMYDWAGPYTEVVSLDAFDATLATSPLVEFTLNHNRGGGLPMAHTRNGSLSLSVVKEGEGTGLWYEAEVDATRSDVADMLKALERGDLAEASFKFRITAGQWSPDYSEYRINEVDLHRGDVSAVNFGANPAATSALRGERGPEITTDLPPGAVVRRPADISEDDLENRTVRI